jgi:hypothetical protein
MPCCRLYDPTALWGLEGYEDYGCYSMLQVRVICYGMLWLQVILLWDAMWDNQGLLMLLSVSVKLIVSWKSLSQSSVISSLLS